jgi:peroxin-2
MFLYRYPTIVERLLGARLVYEKPDMNRAVSFEYMNRQLVWHEFSVSITCLRLARQNFIELVYY